MFAFARAVPADEFAALAGVEDLIGLISAEVADRDAIDPVLSRLMFEAMREAERDPALRERMGAMLSQYRELMVQAVRAEQERGAVFAGAPADAIATLLRAVGDGLLLRRAARSRPRRARRAQRAPRLARPATFLSHGPGRRFVQRNSRCRACGPGGGRGGGGGEFAGGKRLPA